MTNFDSLTHAHPQSHTSFSRRSLLSGTAHGFGALALTHMLGCDSHLLAAEQPKPEFNGGLHHPAKVKRVIQLFMNGGASQMDTFDHKPELEKRHGEKVDFGIKAAATSAPGTIMKSPFEFKQHGESGRWVSSVLPHLAGCVDDLAFLMAMASTTNVHGPASYMQNTGFTLPGFPSFGSWISYGLGNLSDEVPTFVVLPDARGLPYNNAGNFSAGFLPVRHQGMIIKPTAPIPIANLHPPKDATAITPAAAADGLKLLERINRKHAELHPGDSRLEGRIKTYELAARMQVSMPQVMDLSKESEATHQAYGTNDAVCGAFAKNCLTARRMIESGVRFVQVWSGASGAANNWDNHSNIPTELPAICQQIDQPTAALLKDLKARGLLEDTLLIWTTECGRMPFTQGAVGRDHNGGTFVTWLAGAGIKPGVSYGHSDEFGYQTAEHKTMCYDLHATVLHLMGINHTLLTHRHNGIDRRLTDVHGHVVHEILA